MPSASPGSAPALTLNPMVLARLTIALSSTCIVSALLMTHYIPKRFRIHPLPYLSDAGLRDPERIVLSFGLALSAALFLPLAAALRLHHAATLPADLPTRHILRGRLRLPNPVTTLLVVEEVSALILSFFLAAFTAVPGFFYFHHIFAAIFAIAAALWSLAQTVASHLHTSPMTGLLPSLKHLTRRTKTLLVLTMLQTSIIFSFILVWGSIKIQYPFRMIPNKDPRFVFMAIVEYIGTAAFLFVIAIVASDVSSSVLDVRLSQAPIRRKSLVILRSSQLMPV